MALDGILKDFLASVKGARAAIFLDGDGESVAQAGEAGTDIKLLGAWKEIQLDRITEITGRLGLGSVRAVLFSLEEGNGLIAPVSDGYCVLLFMSAYADTREAMTELQNAVELLKKDIE
jgi:predicted regulator of Ras-like GTPase activity (Roadblock/LC7/MglB family)